MFFAFTKLIAGLTVSILTVSSAELPLPVLSETEQWTPWLPWLATLAVLGPPPLAASVTGFPPSSQLGAPPRPLVASLAATVTVTGEFVFQPAPFAPGCETLIAGLTVSILTVSSAELGLPALSETVQLIPFVPSLATLVVQAPVPLDARLRLAAPSVQLGAPARPERSSLAVTVTATGEFVFQPLPPVAVWETARLGGTVSCVNVG